MSNKKNTYESELLNELLEGITPEEQDKTTKKMMLAAKIAEGIKKKGLKKKEFAALLGKGSPEISKWLSGTHNFTIETLMDIERALSIKLLETKHWQADSSAQNIEIKKRTKSSPVLT
ncbi:MAG TPA: helix-turn-helix transcriptional regulator, partial [Gracilimonas sp.]|uniref:helix-turn-helix domain-containing protein n=1 Tax=Gracilimonas sp. TaxID=1974203 RepID=UPI002DA5FF78|nr:helix-turn-helix transcriptional regulator [Gracilimonas sp.]